MLSKSLTQQVIGEWIKIQDDERKGHHKRPIPDFNDVHCMLNTCFFASLRTEEKRNISFACTFNDKHSQKVNTKIIRFKNDLDFTAKTIAKLSSAFNPKNVSIAVEKSTENYKIVGYYYYNAPNRDYFDQQTAVDFQYEFMMPDQFTIISKNPGDLILSRGSSTICRILDGQLHRPTAIPLTSWKMGNSIISNLEQLKYYKDGYCHKYRDLIASLVKQISSKMTGGTLILSFNPQNIATDQIEHGHIPKEKFKLSQLINAEEKSNGPSQAAYQKAIKDKIKYIANLACVDGALLIDHEFQVISFGSKLKSKPWGGKTLTWTPEEKYTKFNTKLVGTRHNSAISFIGAHENTYGWVFSEDGPISALYKLDNESVVVWPDFFLTPFVKDVFA